MMVGGGITPLLLNLLLNGSEGSASCPAHVIFKERVPGTHWMGDRRPQSQFGHCVEEKNLLLVLGIDPLTLQSSSL